MPDAASELTPFTPRDDVDAYFVARDDVPAEAPEGTRLFDPTMHVQGAWNEGEQHLAASAGLLVGPDRPATWFTSDSSRGWAPLTASAHACPTR